MSRRRYRKHPKHEQAHIANGDQPSPGSEHTEGTSMETEAGFFARCIYRTAYALAYGVTYPVMFIAGTIPSDNALVHGCLDGAAAAREKVAELREPSPAPSLEGQTPLAAEPA